jgi:SAM-dependent methyltransferase
VSGTPLPEAMRPCPVCGGGTFVAMADRPSARCSGCGSLERHRALVFCFGSLLASGSGRRCLEAGPLNPQVFGRFLAERGWDYASVDRWRGGHPNDPRNVEFVDVEADLTSLPLEDGSFDLFLAQHVVEEIDDYRAALTEVKRVLRPDGLALVEVPIDASRPQSERQEADRFGNVWRFGRDAPELFASVFGRVEPVPLHEGGYRGTLLACAGR